MANTKPGGEKITPMMQQFNKAKRAHPDALLFFRMGDFYELFYEDAKVASSVLGIALTSRSKGDGGVPMAGVPVKAYEQYLFKLIRAGYKVAICDQIEDPRDAKGIVDRAVTRIVTAGTITEEELLESGRSNFLLAVVPGTGREKKNSARDGLAWIDMSTGAFCSADATPENLADEVGRIEPAEIIIPEAHADPAAPFMRALRAASTAPITPVSDWLFESTSALGALFEHFGVNTLRGFGIDDGSPGIQAAGAALCYIRDTQMDKPLQIKSLSPYLREEHLFLDRPSRACLELVVNQQDGGKENTLLACLDRTKTPMGSRLLREWILLPSTNLEGIASRQSGVEELFDNPSLKSELGEALGRIFDIQRITTKILANRANARDLVNLRQSIGELPHLMTLLKGVYSDFLFRCGSRLDALEDAGALLEEALVDNAPATLKEGGVIREGYNAELDEIRAIRSEGKGFIKSFQEREIERTGITKMKVGYNRVFGFYIEITNANRDAIPADYIRKQTLKNAERYITPELKEYEVKVLTSDERIKEIEYRLFQEIREKLCDESAVLQRVAAAVAEIDVIRSLAEAAALNGYVRPGVSNGDGIDIKEGRHPGLELAMEHGEFVPNDACFGKDRRLIILTGPNMAGKSTYLRQTAIIVVMAQIGSFVPAASAELGPVDRIFTRVGASDDLARGSSTFMVEMEETANILHNATERSLIILDEVGRGTSTFDGLSLAWAISEYIHDKIGARTLFATHYHQLTQAADEFRRAANLSIAVREWENRIIFLRRIIEGGTDKSYGIHVARLAGIPAKVLNRAADVLRELELRSPDLAFGAFGKGGGKTRGQLNLFRSARPSPSPEPAAPAAAPDDPVREELAALDIERTSPIEALLALKKLKELLDKSTS